MIYNISLEDLIQKNKKYLLSFLKKNLINIKMNEQWVDLINKNKNNYIYQKIIFNKLYDFDNNESRIYLNNDEPDIIIITSGQSNSAGWGTTYNPKLEIDQVDKNIFCYNIDNKIWCLANLSNDSLGSLNQNRFKNQNSLAFQFAKNLIKNNPMIKVGLICISYSNRPICNWVKYNEGEIYYNEHQRLINSNPTKKDEGIYFDEIEKIYEEAMGKLRNKSKLNLIIWHQGETDMIFKSNLDYYEDALKKLIENFDNLTNNKLIGFIGGTILNNNKLYSNGINSIIRKNLNDLYNYAELSNLGRSDELHFTTESIRESGKLYYNSYELLVNKLKK